MIFILMGFVITSDSFIVLPPFSIIIIFSKVIIVNSVHRMFTICSDNYLQEPIDIKGLIPVIQG